MKKSDKPKKKAVEKFCIFDNSELKFWWANKCLKKLSFFESTPGTLDFEITSGHHFDLINRLDVFQKNSYEFSSLLNSYFIIPWGEGPFFNSHEDAYNKIQNEYLKSKNELINFINCYSPPKTSQINEFASFFNLSREEVEILHYGLMDAYTTGSGFTLSLLKEDDLFNKISIITNLSSLEIKECLLPSSTLLKEKVFIVTNNEIHFNPEWDEFFFEGQFGIRKNLLKFNSKTSLEDLRRLKRMQYGDALSLVDLPYKKFLKIQNIKKLYSYPQKDSFKVDFVFEESDAIHPFEEIIGKLGVRHDFRDLKYEMSQNDSSKIVDGRLSVFYSNKVFLKILDELKIHYPEYFNLQVLPLLLNC